MDGIRGRLLDTVGCAYRVGMGAATRAGSATASRSDSATRACSGCSG